MSILEGVLIKNGLLTAFALIGVTMLVSYWASEKLTRGRLHGSAVAILFGLLMAVLAGGKNGVALMGGAMLRDFAIVATAFGVRREEFVKSGVIGMASLFLGLFVSFFAGGAVAFAFGYRDPVSITTIGAGAATYIVGPVTGGALGASGEVIALSIAAGLVKAIAVMIATPFLAKLIGLNNPRAAMIFGGLMGTNSGVMAGLAATDPKLVPYGAMTATFYTGLGCLLGPSVMFMIARALF